VARTETETGTETELAVLVAAARRGDSGALSALYEALAPRVYGLCRHLLGSPEAAEDARNEVFLRLQPALDTYDATQPFRPWLLSVASHYCVDLLRRRRVEARLFVPGEAETVPAPVPSETEPSPLGRLVLEERRAEVLEAIRALPESYRLPLVLRYYGELSYDEIARQLGLTRTHVATLLFRAKQVLRRRLHAATTESRR
jgi:RNA polymerase sigma-70 factor (ECF subfamily)